MAERTLRRDPERQRWDWDWPPNYGFLDGKFTTPDRIPDGLRLDRIGSDQYGGFMGKAGDTYGQRALSPGKIGDYFVVEGTGIPINTSKYEIRTGTVVPAMGQPGLGTQWVVIRRSDGQEVSLKELSDELGYIRIVSKNGEVVP